MNKGSAADVMRFGWPSGMEEEVVRCILKQALEGLNYLHMNGMIHRDIKAANMLIDDDGTVLLGDLGVAASLVDDQDNSKVVSPKKRINFDVAATDHTIRPHTKPRIGKRKSFVGTPCWMAPELIQGKQYDSSADIWSFGITALELTQGRPPHSRDSPHAVLLQTVQGVPPTLDRAGGEYKYSRAFKEIVDACLVKDPSKRPTAEELLQSTFFKAAKKKNYLVGAILDGLPPLTQRQERTVLPAAIRTHGTMDSWDFTLTASPTASFRLRPAHIRRPSQANKGADAAGVFEFEAEDTQYDSDSKSSEDAADPQLEAYVAEPLSSPEVASSISSQSSVAPSPNTAEYTTASDADADPGPKRPDIEHPSSSRSLPVPKHAGSRNSALPNSNPAAPSPSLPSAPDKRPAPSGSGSFWRKITGGPDGAPRHPPTAKSVKGFLSRKAVEASDVPGKTKNGLLRG